LKNGVAKITGTTGRISNQRRCLVTQNASDNAPTTQERSRSAGITNRFLNTITVLTVHRVIPIIVVTIVAKFIALADGPGTHTVHTMFIGRARIAVIAGPIGGDRRATALWIAAAYRTGVVIRTLQHVFGDARSARACLADGACIVIITVHTIGLKRHITLAS
jgi:hypothetical protein